MKLTKKDYKTIKNALTLAINHIEPTVEFREKMIDLRFSIEKTNKSK